jgi:hypothetical protein
MGQLTVLTLDLGDASNVAGAKGESGLHEAKENDEPE